jgi:hypothetical protein
MRKTREETPTYPYGPWEYDAVFKKRAGFSVAVAQFSR